MNKSIHSSEIHFEKQKVPRFRRLDNEHISAIESLYKIYPFLGNRVEIHMPYHRAKTMFNSGTVWLWPKFDKRPVGYLIFLDGFTPCIWYPERQEGLTLRWSLPPNFCQNGPIICLANILTGESLLQIEDLIVYEGKDLWSEYLFSQRWEKLREFWNLLPSHQPLLAFTPKIVKPISLESWHLHYDSSIYWIIQPDHSRQPRWFWKDTVTSTTTINYIPPKLKRNIDIPNILCAYCTPYTKVILPDTYSLLSQEGNTIGIASIATLELSLQLRNIFNQKNNGIPVEVKWNESFDKYQIVRIMPEETPITTLSFFNKAN